MHRIDDQFDKTNRFYKMQLSQIFTQKRDLQLVNFFPIPNSAFKRLKYIKPNGEIILYDNLFQVNVRNKSIIFSMEDNGPQEVSYTDDFK